MEIPCDSAASQRGSAGTGAAAQGRAGRNGDRAAQGVNYANAPGAVRGGSELRLSPSLHPVFKTLCSHCRGRGFSLCSENPCRDPARCPAWPPNKQINKRLEKKRSECP